MEKRLIHSTRRISPSRLASSDGRQHAVMLREKCSVGFAHDICQSISESNHKPSFFVGKAHATVVGLR